MVDAVVYTLKSADRVLDGEASAAGLRLRRRWGTMLHLHLWWRAAETHWGSSIIASGGWAWGRRAWRREAGHCGVDRVELSWELEAKLASWVSTYPALLFSWRAPSLPMCLCAMCALMFSCPDFNRQCWQLSTAQLLELKASG